MKMIIIKKRLFKNTCHLYIIYFLILLIYFRQIPIQRKNKTHIFVTNLFYYEQIKLFVFIIFNYKNF